MADAYVYYFTSLNVRTGERDLSKRRATLEAIKRIGEPVMDSQIVVDPTELDSSGFLVGRSVSGSHPSDELWGEIRSLNLRAASRDREAQRLDENTEDSGRYILSVESLELRRQATQLQKQRADLMARELGSAIDASSMVPLAGRPTTG